MSNARIVKFSKNGTFIRAWGKKGSGPGEFDAPHSLAMDSRGRLFVADRGNSRIQIFDQDGKFLEEWKQFGRPSGLYIDKNDTLYSADTQSDEKTNPGYSRGIRIGSTKDGKVTALISDPDPDGTGEGVAADASGNVYGALTAKQALRKYVKKVRRKKEEGNISEFSLQAASFSAACQVYIGLRSLSASHPRTMR